MVLNRRLAVGLAAVATMVAGAAVGCSVQELARQADDGEYTGAVIPEFDSWPEMQAFIEQRHARLREYAERNPNDTLTVVLTPTHALTVEGLQSFTAQYDATPYYIEFEAGSFRGVSSLSPSVTLESLEQGARDQGAPVFQVTYVAVSAQAQDLASLSADPLTALLDATPALDLREGLRPADELVNPPRSVFRDYQRLAPDGAGEVGYGTPWPLRTPASPGQ